MQRDLCVEFPPFRLDLANHELWREGERLPLRPKPFALLAYLATNAQRLVPREELAQAVWPDTHVGEGLLRGYVRDVRAALGDDAEAPRFVETVARLGYRFIAPVRRTAHRVVVDAGVPAPGPPPDVVGRAPELDTLARRLDAALAGGPQCVFVTGEAGIGKTTLVDAFVARAVAEHDLWSARGQCVEHFGSGEAYLPLLEALGRLARGPHRDDVIAILTRHAPTWLVEMPSLVADAELDAVQRRVQGASRERMLRELAEAIEVLTALRPLLLVLEDLQWSDHSTVDVVSSLARRRGPARLLLLGTYRPADVIASAHPLAAVAHELRAHGQCVELALRTLAADEIDAYLARRLPGRRDDAVGRAIHRATDGNPLFLVNLVDYWIARGVLAEDGGAWRFDARRADDEARVPDTLRQTIGRQLDRVSPETRRVLEAASVAGAEFSTGAVAAALEEPEGAVDGRCEELAARGAFVRACGIDAREPAAVAGRYAFLHGLYRQVLYEGLAATRRVRLHRRIGEWEAAAYGPLADEHAAELAVHFEQGYDHVRAVHHLDVAARTAMRRHAYREAAALLDRALALVGGLPPGADQARRELSLQMALGTLLLMTKGYAAPEVQRVFTRAHELGRDLEDSPELAFALAGLYRFFFVRAHFATARELGDLVMRLAETRDPSLLAVAHGLVGPPLMSIGEFAAAREHLEQAVALYDFDRHRSLGPQYGDDPGVTSLGFLALALWFLGHPDRALERSRAGEALAERLAAPYSIAFARDFRAWVHVRRGEPAAALACSDALVTLAAEQGFDFFRAEGTIFRGWARAQQGDVDSGIAEMRDGVAAHRASGAEMGRPSHLALLAETYAAARQPDAGLAVLEEALATVAATGERSNEADLYRLKGECLRQKAKSAGRKALVEEAEACLHEALAIARRQGACVFALRAALALCQLRETRRDGGAARRLLAEIHAGFREGFDTADLRAVRRVLRGS